MEELNVLVVGSLHHNTLGVVRSLGEAGVQGANLQILLVTLRHEEHNLISSSKYVDTKYVFFVNDYDEIVPWLQNHYDGQCKVVICCSDGGAEAVISRAKELQGKYKTPNTIIPIEILSQKSQQGRIAKACGLNVPDSIDYQVNRILEWNDFPCIIKPYRSATGAGKDDVRIFATKDAMVHSLHTLGSDIIQIQQYIDKEMEYQLIGCSFDEGKTIIIPGFTKMIRQPKNTNTGYLMYSPINELDFDRDAVEMFIREIGYSGLFSVEFIRGKDGKDYFLEINMRNDGNAYCVKSAGVNLPYLWAFYQTYGKIPDIPLSFSESIYFIPDFNDLKVAFKQVGLIKWVKQFKKAQSHSIYNKQDMKPFRYEFWRQVKRVLKIRK